MKYARRLYPLLLRLYPRRYREAFGDQMLQTLLDYCHATEVAEGEVGLRFWLAVLADEVPNLCRQHREALAERQSAQGGTAVRWMVSAVLSIPLFVLFYAALVKAALALPHPPVSGAGFVLALGALLIFSGVLSLVTGYIAASAAGRIFRGVKRLLGVAP